MISSVASDDVAISESQWSQSGFLSNSASFSPFPPKQLGLSSCTIPQKCSVCSLPIQLISQSSRSALTLSSCKLRMGDATIVFPAVTYVTISHHYIVIFAAFIIPFFSLFASPISPEESDGFC